MGAFEGLASLLDDATLENLRRREALGDLHFDQQVALLYSIARIVRAADGETAEDLPQGVLTQALSHASTINDLMDRMRSLSLADDGWEGRRLNIVDEVARLHDWFSLQLRPQI